MYRKSQYGWLLIIVVTGILCFLLLSSSNQWRDDDLPVLPFVLGFVFFTVILLLFYKLTVQIRGSQLRLLYGIGIVEIVFPIEELIHVEAIRTPWWWGLGIRITPKGMLYNIQGLRAVRIEYISKGKHKSAMVGSPEPEKLAQRLQEVFGNSAPVRTQ